MGFWKIKCSLMRNDRKNCGYTENLKDQRQKIANVSLTWMVMCITKGPPGRMSTQYGMLKSGKRGLDVEGTGGFFRRALLR